MPLSLQIMAMLAFTNHGNGNPMPLSLQIMAMLT